MEFTDNCFCCLLCWTVNDCCTIKRVLNLISVNKQRKFLDNLITSFNIFIIFIHVYREGGREGSYWQWIHFPSKSHDWGQLKAGFSSICWNNYKITIRKMRVDEKAYCTIHLVEIHFLNSIILLSNHSGSCPGRVPYPWNKFISTLFTPKIVILVIISEKK